MRRLSAIGLALAACSFDIHSGGGGVTDGAVSDAGADAAVDARPDAAPDAAPDAPPDAPPRACLVAAAYVANPGTGRRYRAASVALAWADAQLACAGEGAHLVVIGDAAENTYVDGLLNGPFWIGLSDVATEGTWVWVTGGAVAGGYESWRDGNPNNGGGTGAQNCGEMDPTNSTWNDYTCPSAQLYVCECEP